MNDGAVRGSGMKIAVAFVVLLYAGRFFPSADAAQGAAGPGEMLTAIDAAILISSGVSDPEIVQALSRRPGSERVGALRKGSRDEEIVGTLVKNQKSPAAVTDANRVVMHKNAGDRYFREARFDIAAKEYSLAIEAGGGDYLVYEGRANSYVNHMKARLIPRLGIYSGNRRAELVAKSKAILCSAASSDYLEARKLNEKAVADIAADIYLLQYNMKTYMDTRVSPDVKPYYAKSAQKSVDMRNLRQLYQSQKTANQDMQKIKTELSECRTICEK